MRKKNSRSEFIDERDSNILREFKNRLGTTPRFTDLFGVISREARAPRFYISEEQALKLLKKDEKSRRQPANRLHNKQLMLEEIKTRVDRLREDNPGLSLRDAVELVVRSPAPSYYLTPNAVCAIFYRSRRA